MNGAIQTDSQFTGFRDKSDCVIDNGQLRDTGTMIHTTRQYPERMMHPHNPFMNPKTPQTDILRRRFLQTLATSCVAFSLPPLQANQDPDRAEKDDSFDTLSSDLLRDWCDGMLAV